VKRSPLLSLHPRSREAGITFSEARESPEVKREIFDDSLLALHSRSLRETFGDETPLVKRAKPHKKREEEFFLNSRESGWIILNKV